jgi:hypothetical protein
LLDIYSVIKTWVLALALLVTWVFADDHHVAVTTNDLALVADLLNAGVYLHDVSFSLSSYRGSGRYFPVGLLVSINDATTGEVIWAQLHNHAVLRKDADVVLAHLARNVGKDLVSVSQLHAEHGIGQRFRDRAFDLDDAVFLCHTLTCR